MLLLQRIVTPIAAEDIVATGARQQHLDAMLARQLRYEQGIEWCRISKRFIQVIDHRLQLIHHLRADVYRVQIHAKVLGYLLRIR